MDYPSHGDLWKASHVVVTSEEYEVKGSEDQSNLPEDWRFEYIRVEVEFKVSEVLKGEYPDLSDSVFITTYVRKEKEGASPPNGVMFSDNHLRGFEELPQHGSFYLFLRWDALGKLEPVDDQHYSIIAFYKHEK